MLSKIEILNRAVEDVTAAKGGLQSTQPNTLRNEVYNREK